MNRLNRRALAILCVGVMMLVLAAWYATRGVDIGALVTRSVAFFRDAGPLPFFGAMAILPLVGFPAAPFVLAAGPVFGPVLGVGTVILCALLATVIDVTIAYWIAARAMRPLLIRIVAWLGYSVPEISREKAWPLILLVRVVPGTPFPVQNYLLGLARVPFGMYLLISTVVPAAYIAGMVLFGDALMRGDKRAMIGAGVIFLVAGAVLHQVRIRVKRRRERDAAVSASAPTPE